MANTVGIGRISIGLSATMLSAFVALPLGLPLLGIDKIVSLAFAILLVGVLADSFTTKYVLRIGGKEINPLAKHFTKFLSQNQFIMFIAMVKMAGGLALFAFLPNLYLLMLIALYSLSGVLFNTLGLIAFVPQSIDRISNDRKDTRV